MDFKIGEKYLITTDKWFVAPDGKSYLSVFGTFNGIKNDSESLGVKTNRHSTNWYVTIGNMTIAGCQIHYCIKTDDVSTEPSTTSTWHEGKFVRENDIGSRIYLAN